MTNKEMKLWQLRNEHGEPISPIVDIKTVVDENGPIKPRYEYVKEMINKIIGDNYKESPYTWSELQDIVNRLLIEYDLAPIYISGELPSIKDRDPNKVYIKYRNIYQTGQYGVRIDLEENTIVRIGDNYGKTLDDFYNILPWAGRRRCHILSATGEVIDYFDDPSFDTQTNNYNTMVESPMFYYKRVPIKVENGKMTVWEDWVSYYPHDGYSVHPAFVRDGKVVDKIYIGAYEAHDLSNGLASVVNFEPTCNKTLEEFKTRANARGKGWTVFDIYAFSAEQLLLFISTGSMDCQTSIGRGNSDKDGYKLVTGRTMNMGSQCGYIGTNGQDSVNFFGVENLWGNLWTAIDTPKPVHNGGEHYIIVNDVKIPILSTVLNENYDLNYASIIYHNNIDFLYMPAEVNLNNSIITDKYRTYHYNNASHYIVGGRNGLGDKCGICCGQYFLGAFSQASSRVMFIPYN